MAVFVAFEDAAESEPKTFCGMGAQDDAIVELDLNATVARDIPGLIGAEKQVDLFERALDVDDVGKVGDHLGVIPIDRRQYAGVGSITRLRFFDDFCGICRHDRYSPEHPWTEARASGGAFRFDRNTTQIRDGLMKRQRNLTKPEGRMNGGVRGEKSAAEVPMRKQKSARCRQSGGWPLSGFC